MRSGMRGLWMTGWDEGWDDGVGGYSAATQLPAVFCFRFCCYCFAPKRAPVFVCCKTAFCHLCIFINFFAGEGGCLCKPFPVFCSDTLENCLFLFLFFAAKYLPFLSVFLVFFSFFLQRFSFFVFLVL